MLLDDPTSSLDNKVSADIFNIINNHPRWNKKTFIISTKKLNVLDYVDQVIFMKKGRILYSGNKQGLKNLKEFEELKKFQEKKENEKQEKTLDEINAIVDTEELEQQKEVLISPILSKSNFIGGKARRIRERIPRGRSRRTRSYKTQK